MSFAVREFDRRVDPGLALVDEAPVIARACHAAAVRFSKGGKLVVFGGGAGATDAEHIAVEFLHPVIVGKRAFPAISLVGDAATLTGVVRAEGAAEVFAHQLRLLGEPGDIALGVSASGNCDDVARGLVAAGEMGLLTLAMVGGDGGHIARDHLADHVIVARSDDPNVVKEVHVTAYHVLWELVHVFFEQPGLL